MLSFDDQSAALVKPHRRACAALARKRTFAADTMAAAMRKQRSFPTAVANGQIDPERTKCTQQGTALDLNTGLLCAERLDSRSEWPGRTYVLNRLPSLRMPLDAARFGVPLEDGLECRARRQAITDQPKRQTPAIEKSLKGILDDVRPDGDEGIDSWNDIRKSSREIICVKVLAAIVDKSTQWSDADTKLTQALSRGCRGIDCRAPAKACQRAQRGDFVTPKCKVFQKRERTPIAGFIVARRAGQVGPAQELRRRA